MSAMKLVDASCCTVVASLLGAAAHAGMLEFAPHPVAPIVFGEVAVVDLDGDGDPDILIGARNFGAVLWYENQRSPGGPSFVERTVGDGMEGLRGVFATDFDGDGDVDVLSASLLDDALTWHEHTPTPEGPEFSPRLIATVDGVSEVIAADLDGDGDLDVVSGANAFNAVYWHERTQGAGGEPVFTTRTIYDQQPFDLLQDLAVTDVDGDGDLDVLSASDFDDRIAWYENESDGAGGLMFTERIVTIDEDGPFNGGEGFADGAHGIFAADMDGDGDTDVLSASVYNARIGWHEQIEGIDGPVFLDRHIAFTPPGAFGVSAADMDGDGDLDVVSATSFRVSWHENTPNPGGGGGPPTFITREIATDPGTTVNAVAADMDGDGDQDAVASFSVSAAAIKWFEQVGSPCVADLDGDGAVGGADLAVLLGQWGAPGGQADLDGDGAVGGADLALLLGAWGGC